MIISFVVAASENNVIGKNNQLLWSLPNDMKFFKNTTWAMPVIMGRKTFDSLGKALTGRTNIVITRQTDWHAENVAVASNLDEAMEVAVQADAKEVFIIGGGEIFKQTLPRANKIYLTRVHSTFEGDAFFPDFDKNTWELVSQLNFEADAKHAYPYSFEIWERKH